MRLEGIVSKRTDAPYRSGLSKTWLRSKNPASAAVRRGRQESVTKSPDQSLYLSFGSPVRMRLGALRTEVGNEYDTIKSRSGRMCARQVNDRRSDRSPTESAGRRILGNTGNTETETRREKR